MVLDGNTAISFPEETTIQLVDSTRVPRKAPLTRWKTIHEIFNAFRGVSAHSGTMMYT